MPLAIFDLDNTLIAGDSDYEWGQFLADSGLVDREAYEAANLQFYKDYKAGVLDIQAYLRFALKPLSEHPRAIVEALREQFMQERIDGMMLPAAHELIERHRQAGDTLLIITATNSFVTQPIAKRLGIPHLLASDVEEVDGEYTGNPTGTPCFQDGKVKRLHAWLAENNETLEDATFYSDSRNDCPLLEAVDKPVAVDPDDYLRDVAESRGWPVISLREPA